MIHPRFRQIIYGFAFLLLIGGVATTFYFLRTQEPLPTCFDTIKNGTEEGPDCGGGCIECAEKYPKPVHPTLLKVNKVGNGLEVLGRLLNDNNFMTALNFKYVFEFSDKNGKLITSRSGTYSLAPKKSFLITENNIEVPQNASVELKVVDAEWKRIENVQVPQVSVQIQNFAPSQGGEFGTFAVEGLVRNESVSHLDTVDIVVVLYDSQGTIVGFNKTQQRDLNSFETRPFRLLWFTPIEGTVVKAQGEALVDAKYYLPR